MKLLKILFYCLIFTSISTSAQYGNRTGYGGRTRMPESNTPENKPTATDIEKDRSKKIDGFMSKLKEVLSLDELQYIAIKNDLTANGKAMEIIMKKENSEEAKQKELQASVEKTDKAILSYLNPTQKEKYEIFKLTKVDTKKEDKKRRKEKEKNEN